MSWLVVVDPLLPLLARQTPRPSSPARPSRASFNARDSRLSLLVPEEGGVGCRIFRNPDNVRVRRMDAFAEIAKSFETIPFRNCTRVSYFLDFIIPVSEKFGRKLYSPE